MSLPQYHYILCMINILTSASLQVFTLKKEQSPILHQLFYQFEIEYLLR